jgi:hypothetical protein
MHRRIRNTIILKSRTSYALLPKKGNAMKIQEYRPICLLNVSFKIFTKVATNRVSNVAEKMIRPTQTVFMTGVGYFSDVRINA